MAEIGAASVLASRSDHGAMIAAVGSAPRLVQAAVRFFRAELDGVAISRNAFSDELASTVRSEGYTCVDVDSAGPTSEEASQGVPGRVSVVTSGSTGTPKLVAHTWSTLFTARSVTVEPRRWLVTYQPGTYAWYQVLTLGMFVPEQDLVVPSDDEPEAILDAGLSGGANAISATPTFWQYLLLKRGEDIRRLPLRQLTLGGEPVSQRVLDMLRELFPEARLTHIYASSEAGVGIVVHDGREGFPSSWLASSRTDIDPRAGRPQLWVEDEELWVCSPHGASGTEGWIRTGDAVAIRGDRIVVVGRKGDDRLIVGGRKISRERVESALVDHPSVRWCRVRTRATPTGAVVVAELVLDDRGRSTAAELEHELTKHANERGLPEWAVPRLWRFLPEVPIERNRKARR